MRIGWIGTGAMGAPMVRRVIEGGHEVRIFDVVAAAASAAAGADATAVVSPAEAAGGAEALVLMVATPAQAEEALFGPLGAAETLAAGAVVVVTATVGVVAIVGWRDRLLARGVQLVDAPVSGGVARAGAGELLMMVAGAPEALAAVEPVFSVLAAQHPVVGGAVGDAQKVKLVNQLLCGVHIAAAGEALAFATALGLDPRACWEVIRRGAAASFMLDDRGARMLQDDPPVRSAVDIFVKDMGLVVEAAEGMGRRSMLAETAGTLFRELHDAGLGRADDSAVFGYLRGPAGALPEA